MNCQDCQNCCKQYTCKTSDLVKRVIENCNDFKSWIQTKNYGVPRRIEYVLPKIIKER